MLEDTKRKAASRSVQLVNGALSEKQYRYLTFLVSKAKTANDEWIWILLAYQPVNDKQLCTALSNNNLYSA